MSKTRILLFSMALILTAIGCALTMVGGSQNTAFSTEAWLDSLVCTTDWYPAPLGDDTQDWKVVLSDRIMELDLDMELVSANGANSGGGPCYQTEPPFLHAIELNLQVPYEIFEDDAELGYRIRAIIIVLEDYHDDLAPANDGNLIIYFRSADRLQSQRWSFQYSQAVRAVDAGLDGEALLAVGRRQIYPQ